VEHGTAEQDEDDGQDAEIPGAVLERQRLLDAVAGVAAALA
jgi:hypothetical protein